MVSRPALLLLGVLLLVGASLQQQSPARKKPLKKESSSDSALERLQKSVNDIIVELNVLKEMQALQTVCLKGVKIGRKCFLFEPLLKRYHTASDDCNALGGVLGSPTAADENRRLADYVRENAGDDARVWLGVNDMVTEGLWADQTGASVAFKNWDVSDSGSPQPDGGAAHNCAVLSSAPGGWWSDENCRDDRQSVCEFNIV